MNCLRDDLPKNIANICTYYYNSGWLVWLGLLLTCPAWPDTVWVDIARRDLVVTKSKIVLAHSMSINRIFDQTNRPRSYMGR